MNAREQILARLRAARPTTPVTVPRDYRRTGPADEDLVALLADRLADYRATVRRCAAPELPSAVAELLADATATIVPPGIPDAWLSAYRGKLVRDGDPPLAVADLDAPGRAVLTGCAVAVAQTGTIMLDAGTGQGRRLLSLIPDHHLCVVATDQIVFGVPEALARLAEPTRPLTLVSGPSATSDIELSRVEGVHGPRRLDVLIVD
ncbi:LutC/YkgG family protein [Micromonospora eburnea]|uniref:L-lactate dehydrogenase complex protein LldG n=1 Tax=Micromonospora eburnea TaxID=227316 RepID=A0A1C6UIC6_9ACTN|nr:lactate utilization protein C [Micromonospora eburnea]SCL53820.1 L-lactate dehydrogenase complex protein LldG [Micromonospora eburnea]